MKEVNDFERTTLKGLHLPIAVGSAIVSRRCIKCNKVFFVNYKGYDYECHRCRNINVGEFEIKTR